MITVILNAYKRTQYLKEQIEAVQQQSVAPADIWVWYNKPEGGFHEKITGWGAKVIYSEENFMFHGRFALGLLVKTPYVAFFDDDIVPGKNWFKNCLETEIKVGDKVCILGASGVRYQGTAYHPHIKYGWNGIQSASFEYVDLVGHAWFMKKEALKIFWGQEPISWENGEDIQLSAFASMFGEINTVVPPHISTDKTMWGNIAGEEYGLDSSASWRKNNHMGLRNSISSRVMQMGYKRVIDRGLQWK